MRINVAVLAYDDKVLWDCRNFLYDFIDKTNYNLGITLDERFVCYLSWNEICARWIGFDFGVGSLWGREI